MQVEHFYYLLLALRAALAFLPSPSTIHPDEYRQSCDVVSALLSPIQLATPRIEDRLPWEFNATALSRSYSGALVSVGPPIWMGLALAPKYRGWLRFFLLRAWALILSLVGDAAFMHASRNPIALVLRASSWVAIVLLSRSFSNSLEALILDLLLCTAEVHIAPFKLGFLGGALLLYGCFVRVTFPAFAAPVVAHVLLRQVQLDLLMWRKKEASHWQLSVEATTPKLLLGSVLGALMTFGACVMLDSAITGNGLVIAPLNNLLYNTDTSNLAKHGLHPRYTHILLNCPIMFGPLFVACASIMLNGQLFKQETFRLHALIICSALTLLSAFPHQEPRFLTPLLSSMAVIGARSYVITGRGWLAWFTFNCIMIVFFGFMHQGGLVKATIQAGNSSLTCLAGIDVYPLPRCLGVAEMTDSLDQVWVSACRAQNKTIRVIAPRPSLQTLAAHHEFQEDFVASHWHFSGELGGVYDLVVVNLV